MGLEHKFIKVPFFIAYIGTWVLYCLAYNRKNLREKIQCLCEDGTYSNDDTVIELKYNPIQYERGIITEVDEYVSVRITG